MDKLAQLIEEAIKSLKDHPDVRPWVQEGGKLHIHGTVKAAADHGSEFHVELSSAE